MPFKLGIWPLVETRLTKRASHNRPAGVEEQYPIKVDRTVSRKMLLENILPAIKAKWPEQYKHEQIWIQQDNAKPHVYAHDAAIAEAGHTDGWSIDMKQQPAQSPDLNVLDLGFFNSIQALQSRTSPKNIPQLIKEVLLAFSKTTAETLNKTFLTLQVMMESIMINHGGNGFSLCHIKKDHLARINALPVCIECSHDAVLNAREVVEPSQVELGGIVC